MGEETDNVIESTSKLQEKIKALSGVDILTDAGAYKDTYTILKEIGTVWEDMADIDQAALLELMAGKNRANTLSAILSNMEDLGGAYESALNAEGSALKENETYLDSIQGRIDLFSNSIQTMWMNTLSSDAVKWVVDLGTAAIKLVDTLGLIPTILGSIAGFKLTKSLLETTNGVVSTRKQLKELVNAQYQSMQAKQQDTAATEAHARATNADAASIATETKKSLENAQANQKDAAAHTQAAVATEQETKEVLELAQAESLETSESLENAQANQQDAAAHNVAAQAARNEKNASGGANFDLDVKNASVDVGSEITEEIGESIAEKATKNIGEEVAEEVTEEIVENGFEQVGKNVAKEGLEEVGESIAETGIGAILGGIGSKLAGSTVGKLIGSAVGGVLGAVIGSVIFDLLGKAWNYIDEEIIHKAENSAKAAEEAINSYKQAQTTLKDQKKTIDELSASYEKLSKGVNLNTNENINLTTDSYKEYLDICNDIADMYPHLVTGYDAQGNAILSLKGNVDDLTKAYKDAAQAARQQMIASGGDIFDTFKTEYGGSKLSFWRGAEAGSKQQLSVAKELHRLISSGTDEEIKTFFKDNYWWGNKIDGSQFYRTDMIKLFEDAGIDSDLYSFWDGSIDPEEFRKQIGKINSYIKKAATQANIDVGQVKSLMDAYLGEDAEYAQLSEKSRSLINQIVSGFSAEFVNGFADEGALYNWIKTDIISAFQDKSVIDVINSLSDLQLEFATGDILYSDYKDTLTELISQIQNKIDEDALAQIKIGIGIDEASLQTAEDHAVKLLGGKGSNDFRLSQVRSLSVEDLQIAGQLEVSDGTILSWEELVDAIENVKIAATQDFDITNFTDAISAHSSMISEYQEALQSLDKGSFTMDDFMELIKKYPELAKGVDISSNAFHGLSRNLSGAIKTSTKNFIKDLKELRASLVAAGKSTSSIDQLIESVENMSSDALDDFIQKYSTLGEKIKEAKTAQDKLAESMGENPNEGYETRGEAMEYMKEAMKKGEIGSESNLWNVAEKYGFTYDSAKSINENADALAKFIAIRERWFKEDDDGDNRTSDGYSYKGTEAFIEDVESAVKNNADLQQYLTWDYNEETGALNFDYNNEDWDTIVSMLSKTKELAGLTSNEFSDMMIQIGQYFGINWGNYDDVLSHLNGIATGTSDAKTKVEEYGKTMQDYFGENSDVDLTVRPMVKFDSTNFDEWKKYYQKIIDNPDGHSEDDVKNAKEQVAAIDKGDSYATVYSSTFSNEDGSKSIVVTPILPNGDVLSPEELEDYANKLLSGEEIDPDINIKLAEFDGANSIKQANEYAQALHEAQAEYDILRDTLHINTTIDEKGLNGLSEIKELKDAITTKDDGTVVIDENAFKSALTGAQYTEDQIDIIIEKIKTLNKEAFNIDPLNIDKTLTDQGVSGLKEIEKIQSAIKESSTGWTVLDTDLFSSLLKDSNYTEQQIDELIKKIQVYQGVVFVSGNTDPLGLHSVNLNAESLKSTLETLGIAYSEGIGKWGDGKTDINFKIEDVITALKNQGWTNENIKKYITEELANVEIDGIRLDTGKGIEDIDKLLKKADETPEEKTTEFEVTGTGLKTLEDIKVAADNIPTEITTTHTTEEVMVYKTEDDTDNDKKWYNPFSWFGLADGTAHASGTAFADGNWGASKTETALVGELGPELV